MRFITLASINGIANSNQIDCEVSEIFGADVFAFSHPVTLNQGQGQID